MGRWARFLAPSFFATTGSLVLASCGESERGSEGPDGGAVGSGTGGAAGTSGASGTGGAAGSTSAPAGCAQQSFVEEDVVARATVALTSCLADDGFWRTQMYLRETQGGFTYVGGRALTLCLAAVTTGCTGTLGCFGLSERSNEPCDACEGNSAVLCGEGFVWDCGMLGGTCSAGACTYPDREDCEEETTGDFCDPSGRPVSCDDHLNYGPACSALGLECIVEGFESRCRGTGSACTWENDSPYPDVDYEGVSCSGSTLSACVEGNVADLRCECFGPSFSCQNMGQVFFCGSADECDPRTHVKTCSGTEVEFCNGGKLTRIDCAALGFTGCSPDADLACTP